MRILIVLPSQGVYGGMELFALTLADWLHGEAGVEVRLCFKLVSGYSAGDALRERCAELGLSATFCASASGELLHCIRWADIVHANNCSFDIALIAKALRKRLVITVHSWRRPDRSLRNRLWRLAHDLADHRTYNSRFVMDTWLGGRGRARSEVIPTVTHFGGEVVAESQRRGFFFIARWIEGKGLPELVEAYRRADIDRERWPLTLAGIGPLQPAIVDQIRAASVVGITLPGFLAEPEKYRRIAASKWLVCPPDTREDMGLTPIEARQLGVPSIVTVDGGVPESAGPHALFVPPGDVSALARALELAAGMGEDAYLARAQGARRSLDDYLKPLSEYTRIYSGIR